MIQYDTISLLFPNLLPRSNNEFLPKKNNMSDIHSQEHVTLLVHLNLIETDFFSLDALVIENQNICFWHTESTRQFLIQFWHTSGTHMQYVQ